MSHDGGPPDQSLQFLQQLHILGQEIAHHLVEILALLLRDAFQTLLQLAVKVNRQTQACSLAVKLASLRFGKVVISLQSSVP
jgi:hypothetical protein